MVSPFERGRRLSYSHDWAIFPLATRTTWQPLTSNGHHGATDDEAQLKAWMAKWPTANYGVNPRASGLIVLDFDRNHLDGADGVGTWRELLAKHNGGRDLVTFTVMTPGDGLHLYFQDPGFSADNTPKGKPAPGVDVKWNGFVAGPGCVRDQTQRNDGSVRLGGEYRVISRRDITPAPMPEWLVAWISKRRAAQPTQLTGPKASDHDTVRRVVQMASVLSRIEQGGAQEWINRELPKIGQYVAAGQIPKQDVLVRFRRALMGWTGFDRVMDHIERQLDYGIGLGPRPWMATKPTTDKPKPAAPTTSAPVTTKSTPDLTPEDEQPFEEVEEVDQFEADIQLAEYRMEVNLQAKLRHTAKYRTSKAVPDRAIDVTELKNLPRPEPLIQGIMGRGASTLLYAGTNVGKSMVALDMAMSVATGHPWLDRFPVYHGRVLWIAGEGVYSLLGRMKAWQYANKKPLRLSSGQDVFKIIPTSVMFASEDEVAETVAYVRDGQFDLVVIDTLAMNSVGFNENAPMEMTTWWTRVNSLRNECERLAILVLHHEGKGTANQNTTFKEPRGATSIKDVPETVIRLSKDENDKKARDLEITKQRDMPSLGKKLVLTIDQEPKSGEPVVYGREDTEELNEDGTLSKTNARTRLFKFFVDNFSETGTTQSKLYTMALEAGICKKTHFYNVVNDLIKSKELVSTKRGNGVFLTVRGHLDEGTEDDL